jgi:hypothetical protein
MTRHDDTYNGFRFIVDTIDAGGGRYGFQAVVDGKRPLIGIPCASEAEALARGVAAAKAKIDEVLQSYRKPGFRS